MLWTAVRSKATKGKLLFILLGSMLLWLRSSLRSSPPLTLLFLLVPLVPLLLFFFPPAPGSFPIIMITSPFCDERSEERGEERGEERSNEQDDLAYRIDKY